MATHSQASASIRPRNLGDGVYRFAGAGDPDRYAARWLDAEFGDRPLPPLLIVIGLAGGELLDEIDRRGLGTRVLALEPDLTAAEAFLARADLIAWRSSGRLKYLAAPDFAGAEDAWRIFPAGDGVFRLMTHPHLVGGAQALNAAKVAKTIVFGAKANAEARRRFAPRYLLNVIRNLPAIATGRDVQALSGRFKGVPAVITAAGPSLDGSLEHLHDLRSRSLLIATDTTLRPLLGAGIVPHLAVGADPGWANARHFRELPPCDRTWLVAESALDAAASDAFGERIFWFRLSNHHPWPWLTAQGLRIDQLEMWGSVLTAAFQVACLAGCDPIVITGADLAFTGGRPYCRGTTYEFDWAAAAAMGAELEQSWHTQTSRSQQRTVSDLHGNPTTTTRALLSFRDWMVAHARRSGRRVINATGAGTLFGDGIVQMPLEKALAASPRIDLDLSKYGTSSAVCRSPLAAALHGVERQLAAGTFADSPLAEWREFSGEAFDAAALSQAIQASSAALESRSIEHSVTTVIPWGELDSTAGSQVLSRLTEATVSPGQWTSSDTSRLLDALRVLDSLAKAVANLQPVGLVDEASRRGSRSPASLFAWPESIRWSIQLFEALIGPDQDRADAQSLQSLMSRTVDSGGAPAGAVNPPQVCLWLAVKWAQCARANAFGAQCDANDLIALLKSVDLTYRGTSSTEDPSRASAARLRISASREGRSAHADLWIPPDSVGVAQTMGLTKAAGDVERTDSMESSIRAVICQSVR